MTTAIAHGKINLFFKVGSLQKNGYHDVVSLYQALEIYETVTIRPSLAWGVSVTSSLPEEHIRRVPTDETNICIKAALALAEFAGISNPQPMHFAIDKQIPVAGGMAGGSADAAASLIVLNQAWSLGFSLPQLLEVGANLGADVPFSILGGTALGTGSGAELEKLKPIVKLHIILIFTPAGLATKDVFAKFDQLRHSSEGWSDSSARAMALASDLSAGTLSSALGENSLTDSASELLPEVSELMKLDLGMGQGFLSGSGPTVWFATPNRDLAQQAHRQAVAQGYDAILTSTSNQGARII